MTDFQSHVELDMSGLCVLSFKMQLEYHIFNANTGTKARRHVARAKEMFLLKRQKAKMANFTQSGQES